MPIITNDQSIAIGKAAETVGIRYFAGEKNICPPIRVLYPATPPPQQPGSSSSKPISYFQENGFAYFANGYLHVAGVKQGSILYRILSPITATIASLCFFVSNLGFGRLHLPAGLLTINATPSNVVVDQNKKFPLIVFSHGLTGTGQENLMLLSAWAKLGFVVVSVHHTDGSSSRVRLTSHDSSSSSSQEDLPYKHGPPLHNYDANFRSAQVLQRSNEIKQVIDFVGKEPALKDLTDAMCDVTRIIAAGFSYGATTAVLTAHLYPDVIRGLILLDGWFYVDVGKSAGIEFEFPSQAFEEKKKSLDIPSVFVNSEQFAGIPKLYGATCRLDRLLNPNRKSNESDMHVIDGTTHCNFCDFVFWVPSFILQKLKVVGLADPRVAYQEIIRHSTDFLKHNFQ